MWLGVARRQLNGLLPGRFGPSTLTGLRVEIRQVEIREVCIVAPVKDAIELSCLAQSDNVAMVTLQRIFVFVESFLPLLGLHVAET